MRNCRTEAVLWQSQGRAEAGMALPNVRINGFYSGDASSGAEGFAGQSHGGFAYDGAD